MEYLSQLLGDESTAVVEFVENVGRYQVGDPLTLQKNKEETSNDSKLSAVSNRKAPPVPSTEVQSTMPQKKQEQEHMR